jgi:hypothetical protein
MAKYHLKADGSPGVCKAQPGKCPISNDSEHFATKNEARAVYEKNMESQLLSRFEKFPNESYMDAEFKEKVARKRRVEDAVLHADPRKTVIQANQSELERTWDGATFVHPDFRKALPDNEDFAVYVETVQLNDELTEAEKTSAYVTYDEKKGLFTYSYREERDYGPSYDAGYDD